MEKRKTYIVNGEIFETRKDFQDRIKKILNAYEIWDTLDEIDFRFVLGVLEMHPKFSDKIGCGAKSIIIETDKKFNKTRHFTVIRLDGTSIDFSYIKCLDQKDDTALPLFRKAGRAAIAPQMLAFRIKEFQSYSDKDGLIMCPIKGIKVSSKEAHVDHEPPNTFDSIVMAFIKENNIDPSEIKYEDSNDNEFEKRFVDKALENRFRKYHEEKAKLRITSASGNLSQKKKFK